MKKFSPAFLYIAGIATAALLFAIFGFDENDPATKTIKTTQSNQDSVSWYPAPVPSSINFAGEAVPLDRWEVKEQLDREILFNYYWQNNVIYMLKLSSRYFPFIEQTLKQNGIPDDFKYLCVAESNLLNATSRVGATGFWQLMKATAPEYKLEVSETVDERYNVMKSTEAACIYLKQAYAKFGNWTAAAASYNIGMGGFNNHSSYQGSANYYDLVLPEETQRYLFRILAFKYLLSNADSLGFKIPESERYQPVKTRTVTVTSSIPDLATFAKANNSDYKMLKWLNPWLRARSLKARPGKTYEILFPQ
jgi:membrane-bound lytic murein transglycosylase D